ncbi:hypothetical protein ACF0H5_004405 [Mactra antiquata]
MEKENFFREKLSGYNLPAESLAEIKGILTRRFAAKFSEGLSLEGRTAMKEVSETESQKQAETNQENKEKKGNTKIDKSKQKKREQHTSRNTTTSDTDRSNKVTTSRDEAGAARLQRQDSKKQLLSGKNDNVHSDKDNVKVDGINETAKEPDSVEKCIEWVAVNNQMENTEENSKTITVNS